jgi:type 1 fimbria pilin
MMFRIPFLAAVAVSLLTMTGLPLRAADEKVHEATVVKAGDGKITLTFKGDDSKHSHDVAKDAKITLDDKEVKLEELKEGFTVKATMDDKFVIHKIVAKSKKK